MSKCRGIVGSGTEVSNASHWNENTIMELFPACMLVEEDNPIIAADLFLQDDAVVGSSSSIQDGVDGLLDTDEFGVSGLDNTTKNDFDTEQLKGLGWNELWNLKMLRISEVWQEAQQNQEDPGEGQLIALLDSGIEASAHSLFPGMVAGGGYDFVSDDAISADGDGRDSDPTDPGDADHWNVLCGSSSPSWHGTFVGSVAAHYTSYNFTGVAPMAGVLPVRVLGLCKTGYASDVSDAIIWSVGGTINGVGTQVQDHCHAIRWQGKVS
jgi:hypothetical protein